MTVQPSRTVVKRTADVAQQVGGYSELLRLEAEMRALESKGVKGKLRRDSQTGRFEVVA
jgi:hypothetical protein